MSKSFEIGRGTTGPIKISPQQISVSGTHARITIDDNGNWTIEDLNSTNGTYIEEDGVFKRRARANIKPSTWIRLGEEGIRGHTFMARRVLLPNDYSQDFLEIRKKFKEFENLSEKTETKRKYLRLLITPFMTLVCLVISTKITDVNMVRAFIAMPGLIMPFLNEIFIAHDLKKLKAMRESLICPKCRRTMSRDDIISKCHPYCKAY